MISERVAQTIEDELWRDQDRRDQDRIDQAEDERTVQEFNDFCEECIQFAARYGWENVNHAVGEAMRRQRDGEARR